jgi:NADPH:quinone reductase-like Zn-dependent oxidoreductase
MTRNCTTNVLGGLPTAMTAIAIEQPGPHSRLVHVSVPLPPLNAGEILVKVAAFGVNRADLVQRTGHYPPPPGDSDILGLEVAGTIVAVAADVQQIMGGQPDLTTGAMQSTGPTADEAVPSRDPQLREPQPSDLQPRDPQPNRHPLLGRRVFGLVPGGGYAQYCVMKAAHAMPTPDHCSDAEAAALAEVFLTAYQAMFCIGGLPRQAGHQPNQQAAPWLLLHAGASGVGTAAIQLAKAAGIQVAVTVGTAEKANACRALGADIAINYREHEWSSYLAAELAARSVPGVDLIIDPVAGDYVQKNINLLAMDGKVVFLAMMGGRRIADLDMTPLFKKRGQLICSTLRNRTDSYKSALVQAFWSDFACALQQGSIKPQLSGVYPVQQIADVHQRMANNDTIGKLVMQWST